MSKRCDWLKIEPLVVQQDSRMFAVREGPLYIKSTLVDKNILKVKINITRNCF